MNSGNLRQDHIYNIIKTLNSQLLTEMHICFISPKSYQVFDKTIKATFGGAEVQMAMLAEEFAKDTNNKVSMMVADYGQKDKINRENITFWICLHWKKRLPNKWHTLLKTFVQIDADVYIKRALSLFSLMSACVMLWYCRQKKKVFVYMIAHDTEVDRRKWLYKIPWTKQLALYLFRKSTLISQNTYQYEYLKKQGITSTIIKSGYPIKTHHQDLDQKEWVLWVGRSIGWKHPEYMIDIATKLPQYTFTIICPKASDQSSEEYLALQKQFAIPNVKFIEFVPFDDIDTYFAQAKVFVNTSDDEWFPNTFIQSRNNKTPVISLNVDPDHILRDQKCGIICNNDVSQIVPAIHKLLEDETFYKETQNKCTTYVEKYHSITNNAKTLLSLIHEHL